MLNYKIKLLDLYLSFFLIFLLVIIIDYLFTCIIIDLFN
jgi:hypothetical protein